VQLGDLVACATMHMSETEPSIADELGQCVPADLLLCGEVVLAGVGKSTVHVELLRSRTWWDAAGLASGWVELQLPELGISGTALVVRTWPFQGELDIGSKHARPVTGRFLTQAAPTLLVTLDCGASIEATARHPFWSVTRSAWVPAIALRAGEQLYGNKGVRSVRSVEATGQHASVYNLEVAIAHTFKVGYDGVLVHNTYLPDEAWDRMAPRQVTPGTRTLEHSRYNPRTGELERSTVHYDEFGRQTARTDYTDHGRPSHGNPHHHTTEYGSGNSYGQESGPQSGAFSGDD
jgi:hypothetical protein